MEPDVTIFTKEALEKVDGTTVPLVKYDKNGNRHVIGEATLRVDAQGMVADFSVYDDASLAFLKAQGIL